jgi:magnesium transporter
MPKLFASRSRKVGLPPGTPVHLGDKRTDKVKITVIDYDEAEFQEKEVESVEECFAFGDKPSVTWINVDGLHDIALIERLGQHFGLHPLVIEDIASTGQRPKTEEHDTFVYIVLGMLTFSENKRQVDAEQVSLILGRNVVISFQEEPGDVFDPVRERIRTGKGRVRKMGADYLVYSLMDAVVDNYFGVCEKLGEMIEPLQEDLIENPAPVTLQRVHRLKSEVLYVRKAVWPLREVIGSLERTESRLFTQPVRVYLRDIYDHTIQVIDTIETYRDVIGGVVDLYLSSVSNRMNEIMKVLTVIATIFIPLTFVAGVYGMNFQFMPELHWRMGYPVVLGVMLLIAGGMLLYFRRRRWI